MEVEARIARLKPMAPVPRDEWEHIAARRLFSTLSQFEQIAVVAAERGEGTPGQLEDELVHEGLFRALAVELGGVAPPDPETADLVDRLMALKGPVSKAILNLVAEQWLSTVFHELCHAGWGAGLFAAVEADEERHVHDAWGFEVPPAEELMEVLPDIERALTGIALSPGFALPISYLHGEQTLKRIGLAALRRHEETCAHLRVRPGHAMRRLYALCRTLRPPPREVCSSGRLSLIRACNGPAPMTARAPLQGRWTLPEVIAATTQVLRADPRFRRVGRREAVYEHHEPSVTVRISHPDGISSVLMRGVYGSPETARRAFHALTARARRRRLEDVPRLGDAIALLPPATASVAITYLARWRFAGLGSIPLVEAEGVPIVVGLDADDHGNTILPLTMDHRLFDASDLADFRNALVGALKEFR